MAYEIFIGARHMASRRRTFLSTLTVLAVVGVALGVAALTAVVSVAGGFVDTFRERVLGVNAHIVVTRFGMYFGGYEEVESAIRTVPGVTATAPFILHEMLATSANSRSRPGALIKGVRVESLGEMSRLDEMVLSGSLDGVRWTPPAGAEGAEEPDEERLPGSPRRGPLEGAGPMELAGSGEGTEPEAPVGVALGYLLAERLAVHAGDEVTLISPLRALEMAGWSSGERGPTWAKVRVAAVVRTGFYDYDNRLVLVDFRALQRLFRRGDVVTGIEVRVSDPFATDAVMAGIDAALTSGRYRSLDWPEINRNLFASLRLQKLALTIVMSCLVVVASFVILCVLVMLVLEKRREISVLRSMGASAGGILRIFLFQGVAIGAMGTALGLVLGWVVCLLIARLRFGLELEVYRIDRLPVSVHPLEFALAAAGALVICALATLYPAWRAARVSPVDGFRYG